MRTTNSPIALEAIPFMVGAALLTVAAFFIWKPLALFFLTVTCFVAFFFRNPERHTPTDESAVIAPADGVVIYLGEAKEEHLNMEMLKISIFMNIFNVHVNRIPLSGEVCSVRYKPGKFLSADLDKASALNERNTVLIRTEDGREIRVVQIAGLIARRIVCWLKEGMKVTKGERFGLIRFGSRVELFIPLGTMLRVKKGDKVRAGETPIGELP